MSTRSQSTTPFKEGTTSTQHGKDAPKTKITSDASKTKFSPGHDPLMQSLSSGLRELPVRYHMGDIVANIHPSGVAYRPDQEFGTITGKTAKGTHYTPHSSPPGKNAVGSNSNRKGGNALGHALNRVGANAIGRNANRKGSNAIGSNANRTGQKSGYPGFKPKGGGRKP